MKMTGESARRLGLALSVACVSLGVSGCVASFAAVKATGETGKKIAGEAHALEASPELCADERAFPTPAVAAGADGSSPAFDCEARLAQARRLEKITTMLVAYATKLSALAQQSDVDVSDQVSSALADASKAHWVSLTSDQRSGVAALAGIVTALLSQEYRSGVLESTIHKAGPHVAAAVTEIDNEVDLRVAEIGQVQSTLSAVGTFLHDATPPPPPPAQAPAPAALAPAAPAPVKSTPAAASVMQADLEGKLSRLNADQEATTKRLTQIDHTQAILNNRLGIASIASLALVERDLMSKRDAYLDLRAAVDAFGAAHAKLYAGGDKLDAKELLPVVIDEVKKTYEAVQKLKASGSGK
jgi:hypothetical protein